MSQPHLFFSVKNVVTEVEPIKAPVHLDLEFAVHVSIIGNCLPNFMKKKNL